MAKAGGNGGEGLRRVRTALSSKKLWRWLPVAVWMAVIFYLSAQPDLPHHPEEGLDVVVKKLGHMVEYGILAGLAWWAWPSDRGEWSVRAMWGVLLFTALYAISDEMHQHLVPGRTARVLDLVFDLLGAGLALIVISGLKRYRGSLSIR
jgi:VanZ family protein